MMMKTMKIMMLSQPNDDAVSIRPFLYDHRPHSSGHPGADRHTHIFHMSSIMIIIMTVVIIISLIIIVVIIVIVLIVVIIITRPYAYQIFVIFRAPPYYFGL